MDKKAILIEAADHIDSEAEVYRECNTIACDGERWNSDVEQQVYEREKDLAAKVRQIAESV